MTLKQLEVYFIIKQLNSDTIYLEEGTTLINQDKFVKSHISALKANSGNRTFLPFYDRLIKFYKIIKN